MPAGEGGPAGNLEAVALQQQDQLPQGLVRAAVAEHAEGDGNGPVSENFGLVLGHDFVGQPAGVHRRGHHQQVLRAEAALLLPLPRPGEGDVLRLQAQPPAQLLRYIPGNLLRPPGGAEIQRVQLSDGHQNASLSAFAPIVSQVPGKDKA